MILRHLVSSVSVLSVAAGLACSGAVGAQTPPVQKQVARVLNEERRLEEAETLRKAYIELAHANHDYDGRRVRAMENVRSAFKMLDQTIMKKGTPAQKTAVKRAQAAIRRADEEAKLVKKIHERQAASDSRLQAALTHLANVQPILAGHKQTKVLVHVDKAILEINTALKIR